MMLYLPVGHKPRDGYPGHLGISPEWMIGSPDTVRKHIKDLRNLHLRIPILSDEDWYQVCCGRESDGTMDGMLYLSKVLIKLYKARSLELLQTDKKLVE